MTQTFPAEEFSHARCNRVEVFLVKHISHNCENRFDGASHVCESCCRVNSLPAICLRRRRAGIDCTIFDTDGPGQAYSLLTLSAHSSNIASFLTTASVRLECNDRRRPRSRWQVMIRFPAYWCIAVGLERIHGKLRPFVYYRAHEPLVACWAAILLERKHPSVLVQAAVAGLVATVLAVEAQTPH